MRSDEQESCWCPPPTAPRGWLCRRSRLETAAQPPFREQHLPLRRGPRIHQPAVQVASPTRQVALLRQRTGTRRGRTGPGATHCRSLDYQRGRCIPSPSQTSTLYVHLRLKSRASCPPHCHICPRLHVPPPASGRQRPGNKRPTGPGGNGKSAARDQADLTCPGSTSTSPHAQFTGVQLRGHTPCDPVHPLKQGN